MTRAALLAATLLAACQPHATEATARCQRHAPPWLQADCLAAHHPTKGS